MATNLVYQKHETAQTWTSAGTTGGNPAVFTPTSLGAAAGRQGYYVDLGTASRGRWFAYRAWLKPGATRVVGEYVEVGLITSDGAIADNDDGTTDIAISSADKLRNLRRLRPIVIDENAAVTMASSGHVFIEQRYVAPFFWNRSANSLSATAGDYGFSLTPVSDDIQASA